MFTSKLPKSTSARRSSNPNEGYTSLIGSHIPVSVRKANLFTPQPKRSLGAGLMSTAGKSYMTTEKKYQRLSKPAPDLDEQKRMFQSLVDFLRMNGAGFPIPDAKRFLSSVSITEASRIFEFLINQPAILPLYKINKLEIDAPEVLQLLDYPYIKSVTKSSLVSITTKQAIGNILTIFNWLVDLANAGDALLQQPCYPDQELTTDVKLFRAIMMNPENPMEEISNMLEKPTASIEELNNKLEIKMAEYNRLVEEVKEIWALVDEEGVQNGNVEECDKYIKNMELYIAAKTKYLEEVKLEGLELHMELEENNKEYELLRREVGTAPPIDEQKEINTRLKEEIKHFERQIEVKKQDHDVAMAQIEEKSKREDKELERTKEQCSSLESRQKDKLDNLKKQFEYDRKSFAETEQMQIDLLKETLDGTLRKAKRMVENAEEDTQRWLKVSSALKQDKKVVKRAAAMLIQ